MDPLLGIEKVLQLYQSPSQRLELEKEDTGLSQHTATRALGIEDVLGKESSREASSMGGTFHRGNSPEPRKIRRSPRTHCFDTINYMLLALSLHFRLNL